MAKLRILIISIIFTLTFFQFAGIVSAQTKQLPRATSLSEYCANQSSMLPPLSYSSTDFQGDLKCPASVSDIQVLVLRLFAILNVVIGVILLFALIKSGITFMTSAGSPDKASAAAKGLRGAVFGFIGVGVAYIGIVTLGMVLLSQDGKSPSFLESNKIVFNFLQFQSSSQNP